MSKLRFSSNYYDSYISDRFAKLGTVFALDFGTNRFSHGFGWCLRRSREQAVIHERQSRPMPFLP